MCNDNYLTQTVRDISQHTAQISRSGLSKMSPLIITCAVRDEPDGSSTPEALAEQAHDAYRAGASVIQIDSSLGPDALRTAFGLIRKQCPDLIISAHADCRRMSKPVDEGYTTTAPLTDALSALPEMATVDITCGVSEADGTVHFMAHKDLERVILALRRQNIKPEFEMTKTTDIKYLNYLNRKDLLDAPYWCELSFGGIGVDPILDEIITAMQDLPDNGLFGVVGIGAAQTAVVTQAIIMGLHVRVGTRDNRCYTPEQLFNDSAPFVERIVRIAIELDRPIATAAQARKMLSLGAPRAY